MCTESDGSARRAPRGCGQDAPVHGGGGGIEQPDVEQPRTEARAWAWTSPRTRAKPAPALAGGAGARLVARKRLGLLRLEARERAVPLAHARVAGVVCGRGRASQWRARTREAGRGAGRGRRARRCVDAMCKRTIRAGHHRTRIICGCVWCARVKEPSSRATGTATHVRVVRAREAGTGP
jgi:hypothetical protein